MQGAFDVHQKRDIVSFTFFKVLPILDVFRSGTVGEGILWLVVHECRGVLGLGWGVGGREQYQRTTREAFDFIGSKKKRGLGSKKDRGFGLWALTQFPNC